MIVKFQGREELQIQKYFFTKHKQLLTGAKQQSTK